MKKLLPLFGALILGTASYGQNNALSLDGIDDYVDCGTASSFNPANLATMECWVKFGTLSGSQEILSRSVGGVGVELLLHNNTVSAYCMADGANYSFIQYPTSSLQAGVWYHFAFAWNGTKENMRLYINGIAVGTRTDAGNINTATFTVPSGSFRIGAWSGTPARPLNGAIDEVRIWSVTRTAAEIKAGMYGAVPLNATGLTAYYRANEGSGTSLSNSATVGGSTGSLLGGATWQASPVQYGSNAISLDGANDYVEIPANTLLDLTTGTLECWVKPSAANYNQCILANRGTSGTRFSLHLNTATSSLGLWNNTSYFPVSYTFTPGQWYHIALVQTATNTLFYVNGSLVGQTTSTFGTLTGQPFTIGITHNAGGDGEAFYGVIDEVRIWNTQRTAAEIASNRNVTLRGTEAGLVAKYSFDQGIASGTNTGLTTIVDGSGNNLHGTMMQMASSGSASNFVSNSLWVLPVTLGSFRAEPSVGSVLLAWNTVSETGNRNFVVERSADGRQFTAIGTVPAAGVASNYQFPDRQPLTGTSYYRLRSVDADGSSSYSVVRAVRYEATGSLQLARQGATTRILLQGGSTETFQVTDLGGRVLYQGHLRNGQAAVSQLLPGTYVISVATAEGVKAVKTRL